MFLRLTVSVYKYKVGFISGFKKQTKL